MSEETRVIKDVEIVAWGPNPDAHPTRVLVKPEPGSRLESLLCLFDSYKTAHEEAEAKYKELKASIFTEIRELYPESEDKTHPNNAIETFDIAGTHMYPPVTFSFKKIPYLPVTSIREQLPSVYKAYQKFKTFWECRQVKS